MSLRVWLPLTKDLRNQGLDDVTVSGGTIDNNGKLGKCYLVSKTSPIVITQSISTTSEWTINFWARLPSSMNNATAWEVMFSFPTINADTGANGTSNINWASYHNIKIWDDPNHQWFWAAPGTHFNYDKWHMWTVAHTANGSGVTGKIYIDGNLIDTYNNATHQMKIRSGSITIGGGISTGGFYINDFRIYDHALSPLEVKQISQGLILHYPLSDKYLEDTTNLVTGITAGGQTTVNNNVVTTSGVDKDTYFLINLSEDIVVGTQYTFSCDAEIPSGTWHFRLGNQNNITLDFVLHNGHNVYTFVANDTSWGTKRVFMDDNGGTTNSARSTGLQTKIYNFQLEKKDHETGFAGYGVSRNSNIVYDTSGFCNNGIAFGTFTISNNTPKYNVSTVFNGTDNAIQTPSLPSMISDKNYTIAVWIYKTVIGSKGYQTIYGGPSGFEIEARNGGANETKFVPWNWGKPMASYELNEWNHCVFVHSDSDCKIYLNGEYIATGTAKASNPSGNYFVGAWNTATQQNFDGLMSDFRIYATALSANDIKSLYQNSAYIDNHGNVYGAVYEEV